jgi:hypothetical protein
MSLLRTPSRMNERAQSSHITSTRLSGRWLILARVVWIVLVIFLLVTFIFSISANFASLHQPCTGDWCINSGYLTASEIHALTQYVLSLDVYAWSLIIINYGTALIWFAVGGILFWRKSEDWMALLVALMLISGGVTTATGDLLYSSSIWRIPENGVQLIVGLAILFTLALFPNGRFVPRWAVWITLINPAYNVIYLVFLRSLRIPGWALFNNPLNAFTWFGCWIILTLGQLYRYFRVSNTLERQQTKWVAFSFFIALAVGFGGQVILHSPLLFQHKGLLNVLVPNSFTIVSLLIPISLGLAMFRYRLWDIDVIINRTLVYGILTVLLALVYFGLIFALQFLLRGIINQNNGVAIVVSTLVIAALFQPLRHRIQQVIDRRFYRSKYDAARTLAAFSETLRNEVDLNQLSGHLISIVQETMEPTHVSLWLKPRVPASKQQSSLIETPPASSQRRSNP